MDAPASAPLIVGELNPYGGDDQFALYPAPDGCSGHRLCCVVLGMRRATYLESFRRTNLCAGKWSAPTARARAADLRHGGPRLILLGSKVAGAFGLPFAPFTQSSDVLVLPHPSGLCRLWNEPGAFEMARAAVAALAPELAGEFGRGG